MVAVNLPKLGKLRSALSAIAFSAPLSVVTQQTEAVSSKANPAFDAFNVLREILSTQFSFDGIAVPIPVIPTSNPNVMMWQALLPAWMQAGINPLTKKGDITVADINLAIDYWGKRGGNRGTSFLNSDAVKKFREEFPKNSSLAGLPVLRVELSLSSLFTIQGKIVTPAGYPSQ